AGCGWKVSLNKTCFRSGGDFHGESFAKFSGVIMKTILSTGLLMLFVCCFASICVGRASLPAGESEGAAPEGRMVAVTAEQEVDIQDNDVAAARVMAFSLAVRQAVEKAYGTYVKVEDLPEGRKIIAQAAAGLKYTILAEQQRKNKYWVKIQAHVLV